MTEGDHAHEFDADARFVETDRQAESFAKYLVAKLNGGWQVSGMSFAAVGERVFGVTVTLRDVVKRQHSKARR